MNRCSPAAARRRHSRDDARPHESLARPVCLAPPETVSPAKVEATLEFNETRPAPSAAMFNAEERVEQLVEVARTVKDEPDPAAALNVLVATVAHDEPVLAYAERAHRTRTRTEQRRAYMRVRAYRARLLAIVRERLGIIIAPGVAASPRLTSGRVWRGAA